MHAFLAEIPSAVSYFAQLRAEIIAGRGKPKPPFTVAEMNGINARFHYAKHKHAVPFDLYLCPETREIFLRVSSGRRILPVPATAKHVGRYTRLSEWASVKADLVATARDSR